MVSYRKKFSQYIVKARLCWPSLTWLSRQVCLPVHVKWYTRKEKAWPGARPTGTVYFKGWFDWNKWVLATKRSSQQGCCLSVPLQSRNLRLFGNRRQVITILQFLNYTTVIHVRLLLIMKQYQPSDFEVRVRFCKSYCGFYIHVRRQRRCGKR